MDNLWDNLKPEDALAVTAAQSKRPAADAPTQQPMRAGIKPAQQRKPSGDQKKVRRQMARNAAKAGDTCSVCDKAITESEAERLNEDIDFIKHDDHLIRIEPKTADVGGARTLYCDLDGGVLTGDWDVVGCDICDRVLDPTDHRDMVSVGLEGDEVVRFEHGILKAVQYEMPSGPEMASPYTAAKTANLGTPEKCAFCDNAPTVWSQWLDSTGRQVLSTNYYCDDHEHARFNWGGQQEGGRMSSPPKNAAANGPVSIWGSGDSGGKTTTLDNGHTLFADGTVSCPSSDKHYTARQTSNGPVCPNCTKSLSTSTKESSTMNATPTTEADLLTALASAKTLAEQTEAADRLEEFRATRRETLAAEGSLWGGLDAPLPPTLYAQSAQNVDHMTPVTGAVRLGHTEATNWMDDLTPTHTEDAVLAANVRATATNWFADLWSEVKADHSEFSSQAHNAASRTATAYGLQSTAAKSVFLDQVKHLASREGIRLIALEESVDTYVSDGRDSLPVGVSPTDPNAQKSLDEWNHGSDNNTSSDPKTKPGAGEAPSLSEGNSPSSGSSEGVENPTAGQNADASSWDVGSTEDKLLTQQSAKTAGEYKGGSPKEGDTAKCHKDGKSIQFFDGAWYHLNSDPAPENHNDVHPASKKEQADKEGSIFARMAAFFGGSGDGIQTHAEAIGPHAYDNGDPIGGGWGPKDVPCKECGKGADDPAHLFGTDGRYSSHHTASGDCGYCAGTGHVSNGAPGMDLGPGFAEFLDCPMCDGTGNAKTQKDRDRKPYTMHGSARTADNSPDSTDGHGGIQEGDTPETGHTEGFQHTPPRGNLDASTWGGEVDSINTGGTPGSNAASGPKVEGTPTHASLSEIGSSFRGRPVSENTRTFAASLERCASIDDEVGGVSARQIVSLLMQANDVPHGIKRHLSTHLHTAGTGFTLKCTNCGSVFDEGAGTDEGFEGDSCPDCHEGRLTQNDDKKQSSLHTAAEHRPLYEIAADIKRNWPDVYFGAVPYLDALGMLSSMDQKFGEDDAKTIVAYLISNMRYWRGPEAARLKAELKALVGRKASRTASEGGASCANCGGAIERDPEGEKNRGWHHADGSKHEHEARPGGNHEGSRRHADIYDDGMGGTPGPTHTFPCADCGTTVERYRGESDVNCPSCGAPHNAGGQRLRDDWAGNPSNWDSEIGDMEGYEMQHAHDASLRSQGSRHPFGRRTAKPVPRHTHRFTDYGNCTVDGCKAVKPNNPSRSSGGQTVGDPHGHWGSRHTASDGCTCATNSDGTKTTMMCPLHAAEDPCWTMARVTGRRRQGSIVRGVCTNCGWMEGGSREASAKTATYYCTTHQVYVGDGNRDTHSRDSCNVEQRKKKDASQKTAEQNGCYYSYESHHSDDLIEVYSGHIIPVLVCGYHLEKHGVPQRAAGPDTEPPEPMPFSSSLAKRVQAGLRLVVSAENHSRCDHKGGYCEVLRDRSLKEPFSISDAKNEDGEWIMSPEQIRSEMAYGPGGEYYDPYDDEMDPYYEGSRKEGFSLRDLDSPSSTEQTPGRWVAEVLGDGENKWARNSLTFDTAEDAKAYVTSLARRWFGMDVARVRQIPEGGLPKSLTETFDPDDPGIVLNYRDMSRYSSRRTALEITGPDGKSVTVEEGICRTCGGKALGYEGHWVHDPRTPMPPHPDGSVAGDAHGVVPKEGSRRRTAIGPGKDASPEFKAGYEAAKNGENDDSSKSKQWRAGFTQYREDQYAISRAREGRRMAAADTICPYCDFSGSHDEVGKHITDAGEDHKSKGSVTDQLNDKINRGGSKTAMPSPAEAGIEIGDIYYSSWGYDQTNIDFYEVTRLMGASVAIRQIESRSVEEQVGGEYVVAVPGAYIGGEQTKRIRGDFDGFSLNSYSNAYRWDGRPKFTNGGIWGR